MASSAASQGRSRASTCTPRSRDGTPRCTWQAQVPAWATTGAYRRASSRYRGWGVTAASPGVPNGATPEATSRQPSWAAASEPPAPNSPACTAGHSASPGIRCPPAKPGTAPARLRPLPRAPHAAPRRAWRPRRPSGPTPPDQSASAAPADDRLRAWSCREHAPAGGHPGRPRGQAHSERHGQRRLSPGSTWRRGAGLARQDDPGEGGGCPGSSTRRNRRCSAQRCRAGAVRCRHPDCPGRSAP